MNASPYNLFEPYIGALVRRTVQSSVLLLVLCMVISCAATPPRENNDGLNGDSINPPVPVLAPAEPQQNNKESPKIDAVSLEHTENAIDALLVGKVAIAKQELNVVLQREPENKVARSLLAQINTNPKRYFQGQEPFSYILQPGDTLSSIAQRFLDEPLKFYILARFNGISNPSSVAPGRTIRVPGYRDTDTPVAALSNESRSEKAVVVQPSNDKLISQHKLEQTQREITLAYATGTDAISAGDTTKALDAFNAVLKLNPEHEGAKKQIAAIKADGIETLHKDALVEYNKQNLDKAIDLWDHVLALLPTHQNAKLYRARAVDLKTRLLKLEQR